jgi:hypothetical protein
MNKKKLLDIYEDITLFMDRNITVPIRRFFESIQTVIKWFPVIWKDRQWDHTYLFIIMRKKLVMMRDLFNSDRAIAEGSKKRAKEMDECIVILDRIIDDFCYGRKCYDAIDEKYGKTRYGFEPSYDSSGEYTDKYCQMTFFRMYADTPEKQQEASEMFKRCMEVEEEERKDDYDKLFKLLNKNVRGWWD